MSSPVNRLEFRGACIDLPGRATTAIALDLVLDSSERVVLMGRSGSGKSLLSRLVLGNIPPAPARVRGAVTLHADDGSARSVELSKIASGGCVTELQDLRGTCLGYVPQGGRENLVPGWSLDRHVRTLSGGDGSCVEAAYSGMARLGLDPGPAVREALATELSEGMIRRALLALSVSLPTRILVVDEPTTGLDPRSRERVVEFLDEVLADGARGLLLTTHDLRVARALGRSFFRVTDGCLDGHAPTLDQADGPFRGFVEAESLLAGMKTS